MRLLLLVFSLILIGLAILQNMLWLAVMVGLLHTYAFSAVGLVLLALGVDAYFGAFSNVPYFSLSVLVWYVVSELLRIRLRIIN